MSICARQVALHMVFSCLYTGSIGCVYHMVRCIREDYGGLKMLQVGLPTFFWLLGLARPNVEDSLS